MSDPDISNEDEPPFIRPPLKAKKGQGAVSNLQGRYELRTREAVDDGWFQGGAEEYLGTDAETGSQSDGNIDPYACVDPAQPGRLR